MTNTQRLALLLSIATATLSFAAGPAHANEGSPPLDCTPWTSIQFEHGSQTSFPLDGNPIAFNWSTTCLEDIERATWQAVRVIDHMRPYVTDPSNREAVSAEQEVASAASGSAQWLPDAARGGGVYAVMIHLYGAGGAPVGGGGRSMLLSPPAPENQVASPAAESPPLVGRTHLAVSLRAARPSARRGHLVKWNVVARNIGSSVAHSLRTCILVAPQLRIVRAPGAAVRGRRACWVISQLQARYTRLRSLTTRVVAHRAGRARAVASVVARNSPTRVTSASVRVIGR